MREWRLKLIFFFVVVFGLLIIARLYFLEVINGDYYRALAQGQQKTIKRMDERGRIFFKGGQILATNKKGNYLFISPKEISDKEATAKVISKILNIPEKEILKKTMEDNYFELIKKRLTLDEAEKLKKQELKGVHLGDAIFRDYPQGTLASQVVGFLNDAGEGQYGLEGYYNQSLKGEKKIEGLKTPWGQLTSLINNNSNATDIWLTIDYPIQFKAEELLKEAKDDFDIRSGQIIVIEPNTGKILALANFPNFDPNKYEEYALAKKIVIFQNSAIQKLFEPGSCFKPITMAAALEEGKVTPETTYEDKGVVWLNGRPIYNFARKKWGKRTMTEVLEKSINTGAIFAERKLGNEEFLKYIKKFGILEPTGIDLEGEVFSKNKRLVKGRDIDFATASFGQGIEMTPIQLVRAFCAIANGGKMVRPYVAERFSQNGKVFKTKPLIEAQEVISSKTAYQLTKMLVSVVENGFGKKAKIPGYYVAGKTGTSQIPFSTLGVNRRGYSNETWQSFIGFAPAYDPKFLILVKLDNPKSRSSEYSAVPIFHDLAK
ncbi:MAG TPA: penicillin-binding protein 2, partial [bacterium]|nr:penicillin-binding protein 2 [bacterium]